MMDNSKLEELLQQSIAASNRTTHAVRAFVSFLFIQLAFGTITAILWVIAIANPLDPIFWLQWVAAILWILGVLLSSNAGWSELKASEMPSTYVPKVRQNSSSATATTAAKAKPSIPTESLPPSLKMNKDGRIVCQKCGNWELIENGKCSACD